MDTLIAVKDVVFTPLQKTDFLLFDKVLSPGLSIVHASASTRAGYDFLVESGLLVDVAPGEIALAAQKEAPCADALFKLATLLAGAPASKYLSASTLAKVDEFWRRVYCEHMLPYTAERIQKHYQTRAVPIMDISPVGSGAEISVMLPILLGCLEHVRECVRNAPGENLARKFLDLTANIAENLVGFEQLRTDASPVAQIILEALPVIDESTPWERIVDFRADETTRIYSILLRKWMRKVAQEDSSPLEIKEELESLIADYKDHLNFHKIRENRGLIETILTTAGSVTEHLFKREFGSAAKALFQVRQQRIRLLESERTAPGREVAYIVKAQEAFAK